jgi:hypothetical protein
MMINTGNHKIDIGMYLGTAPEIGYLNPMQGTAVRAQYIHTAQSLIYCFLARRRRGLTSPENAWGGNRHLIDALDNRILNDLIYGLLVVSQGKSSYARPWMVSEKGEKGATGTWEDLILFVFLLGW